MAKYLVEKGPLSCEVLEDEAGLVRGSIKEVVVYSTGAVEYETSAALTVADQDKVKDALSKRGLPRGKKPQ